MARSRSSSSSTEWKGRFDAGRTFLRNARELLDLSSGADYRSVVTLCVNAAIAFGDAITLARLKETNRGDHAGLVALLRRALGDRFTASADRDLRNLLALKQDAAYGHRILRREDAERAVERTGRFGHFVAGILEAPTEGLGE